ncbi:DUF2846 domain-containing protein [Brumimicrobium oceani]|uniref:DUF2846 domain-containing protein n=1 Tax=Brumimicrobium oceani TaxID=2100725 RepID=UPI001304F2F8|nr:DUF2846 domain-containing protein [Brumimicrobium oceani]
MKKLIFFTSLLLLLTSCASTKQYVKFAGAQSNSETKAQIYVLRPSSFGSAIKMNIYQDDKIIGKLGPNSYLSWDVDASIGEFRIISVAENSDILTIKPVAGKTYYIKQKVKLGVVIARTELELIGKIEAEEMLRRLKKPKSNYAE